jgi:predicted NBD/HSP70 family sugar kinase
VQDWADAAPAEEGPDREGRVAVRSDRDAPVRQGSLRAHNLALVLRQVAASPTPVSRAGVAATTGLTRATISTLVDELLSRGLIDEVDPAPPTGAGRPAAGLRLSSQGPVGLGLEVNVDYLAACVVDLTGQVRHRALSPGDQRRRTAAATLGALARLATTAVIAAQAQGLSVAGAALAVPGLVGPDATVRFAPNLGWTEVPVRGHLTRLGDLPLTVENEANLAALGELSTLMPHPSDDAAAPSFVYLSGEIGVGAGIVLNGELFRGARGWSGEIGHLAIHPEGPTCRCGARGCLEQYANQEALLRLAGIPAGSIVELADRARDGDAAALSALSSAGSALGIAIADVINLLDVATVVLGGIYAPLVEWLRPAVTAEIRDRVMTSRWDPPRVRASTLGGEAAVVGAAGSVVSGLLADPARWFASPR